MILVYAGVEKNIRSAAWISISATSDTIPTNIWVREKRSGNQRLEIDRILLGRISVEAAKTPDDPRGAEQFHDLLESRLRISKA
jgi:hypothetical protein